MDIIGKMSASVYSPPAEALKKTDPPEGRVPLNIPSKPPFDDSMVAQSLRTRRLSALPTAPELEKPEFTLPESPVRTYQLIFRACKKPLTWIKKIAQKIRAFYAPETRGTPDDINKLAHVLVESCSKQLASDQAVLETFMHKKNRSTRADTSVPKSMTEQEWQTLREVFESHSGIQTDFMQTVENDDEAFFDAVETLEGDQPHSETMITGDTPAEFNGSSEKAASTGSEQKEIVLDFLTGLPLDELTRMAQSGVSALGRVLAPVGRPFRYVAEKCLSEERRANFSTTMENAVKDQVEYEVTKNRGRRLAQVASLAGSASPAIPVMLYCARGQDVKDEWSAIYNDRNVIPLVSDLAITFGPAALGLLVAML